MRDKFTCPLFFVIIVHRDLVANHLQQGGPMIPKELKLNIPISPSRPVASFAVKRVG
jgi:hypothetical protein